MKPQDLVKQSILSLQQRDDTEFEEIQHRGVTIKARVEHGDFRKTQQLEIGSIIQDEISFLDLDILGVVLRGDSIVFDSTEYKIEYFTQAVGLYKLFCIKESRYGGRER